MRSVAFGKNGARTRDRTRNEAKAWSVGYVQKHTGGISPGIHPQHFCEFCGTSETSPDNSVVSSCETSKTLPGASVSPVYPVEQDPGYGCDKIVKHTETI